MTTHLLNKLAIRNKYHIGSKYLDELLKRFKVKPVISTPYGKGFMHLYDPVEIEEMMVKVKADIKSIMEKTIPSLASKPAPSAEVAELRKEVRELKALLDNAAQMIKHIHNDMYPKEL